LSRIRLPFENGQPSGDWEVFADGFAGVDIIENTTFLSLLHICAGVGQNA
jgi:TolB-like protein